MMTTGVSTRRVGVAAFVLILGSACATAAASTIAARHNAGDYAVCNVSDPAQNSYPFSSPSAAGADSLQTLCGRQSMATEATGVSVREIFVNDFSSQKSLIRTHPMHHPQPATKPLALNGVHPMYPTSVAYQDCLIATTAPVPQPATMALLASSIPMWIGLRRRTPA